MRLSRNGIQSAATPSNRGSATGQIGGWIAAAVFLVGPLVPCAHAQYTESFQTWSATSADTWQTRDLAAAPFNVPANAVVEIAVRNGNCDNERWGGVRVVGSSLDRRFLLHEAEGFEDCPTPGHVGFDLVVMHVQTDASSDIQHYADTTADVEFVLLGFWE